MDVEEMNKLRKRLANETHALATTIDFDSLIEKGLLRKVGKSYYIDDLERLPKHVHKKIKSITPGRYGARVTFYKETKSVKKMADKLKQFRD